LTWGGGGIFYEYGIPGPVSWARVPNNNKLGASVTGHHVRPYDVLCSLVVTEYKPNERSVFRMMGEFVGWFGAFFLMMALKHFF
jgi:hypothetical protein